MSTDTQSNAKAVVAKALSSIGDIATLPEVTVRIIEIVENPKSTVHDLHEVIKRDPALTAKVLKVVNSAFYGLPGQVSSVDRAIILLGLSAVKNIAIAASISRLFKGGRISPQYTAKDLWRHSVAVGVAARSIARVSGVMAATDEFLLAGLIHDLGLLVERQVFADELSEVCDRCESTNSHWLELEQEIIGADHQMFGDALTTKWRFPRNLRAAIGFHHFPERLSPELQKMGLIVRVADILCCKENYGFPLTCRNEDFTQELLDAAELSIEQLVQVRDTLEDEVAEAETLLMGE